MLVRECEYQVKNDNGRKPAALLWFDRCLVEQHDGDIVLNGVYTMALAALQGFRVRAIIQGLDARGADEIFQQEFIDHDTALYGMVSD